ncbi:SpaA isopeptide-forming pilin-related protein [Streptococcus suis]|uniref:SpaA isopeptide-forming pilin-related protein n=1 Tax=Streptococcus suis TaxID=1307 RepID=UPI000CF68DE7|nr:SpaA isopeptide-forming pilin-related protein [Streptococcus suis]
MVKNKKWMNRHLIMLFILIFTQLFSSLLGVLSARANSPNTEVQHVKIFSRNQELTADDAHPIEMFQDDEEVFTLDRTGIDEQIMEMTLPQDLDFDVQKTLEHNQIRLNQGHFEGSLQVPADQLVQELLEPDGVTRKLRFHFHRFQQQIEFVLRPNVAGLYELSARWSDSKPMEIEQANMEEVSKTGSAKVLVKEKILEETIPSEDNQSQESDSTHSEGQSPTESSGESSPETSEDTTVQEESANPDETNSLTETSPESAENSETSTPSVQEEPSETSESSTSQEESASQTSEPSTSESSETSSADESSEKHSESTKTESGSEESADSETQNKQDITEEKEKLNTETKEATETVEKSEDGKTSFRSAATVRNADIGNGPIEAYFEKSSATILSGESGRYKIYFKVSGALVDKVRNVRVQVQLPTEREYYSLPNDLSRMAIKGVIPVYDSQSNTLNWDFPELLTGQTYETILQVDSKNGIIPNNHNMTSALTISTEGNQVYSSGPVSIQVKSNKPAISVTKTLLGKNGESGSVINRGDEIWWNVKVAVTLRDTGGQYLKPNSSLTIRDDNPSGLTFIGQQSFTVTIPSLEVQKQNAEQFNGVIYQHEVIFRTNAPNRDGDFHNTATATATSLFDETISQQSNRASGSISTGNNPLATPRGEWAYTVNLGPQDASGNMPFGTGSVQQANPNPTVPNSPDTRLGFSMNYNPTPLLARNYYDSLSTGYLGPVRNHVGRLIFNISIDIGWDQGTHPRRVRQVTLKDTSRGTSKTYYFDNNGNSTDGSGLRIDYGASQHFGTAKLMVPSNFFNTNKWNGTRTRHSDFEVPLTNYDGQNLSVAHEGIGPDWNVGWSHDSGWGDYNPTKNDYHFVGLKREIDPNLELEELRISVGSFFAFGRVNYQLHGGKIANGTSENYPTITVELRTNKGTKTKVIYPGEYPVTQGGPFNPYGSSYTIHYPYITLWREDLGLAPDEHVQSYNVVYGNRNRSEILNSGFAAHIEDFYRINPNLKNTSAVRVMNKSETFGELALINLNGTGARVQPFVRRAIGAADDNGLINTELGPRTAVIAPRDNTPALAKISVEFLQRQGNIIQRGTTNRMKVQLQNLNSSTKPLNSPLVATVLLPKGVTINTANPNWSYQESRGAVKSIIDNYNNTGRQLVIYQWDGDGNGRLNPGKHMIYEVNVNVSENTEENIVVEAYGSSSTELTAESNNQLITDSQDINRNGNTTEKLVFASATYNYIALDNMIITKAVKGNRDQDFSKMGHSDLGSEIDYKLHIRNESGSTLRKFVLIDVLPSVGDRTVLSGRMRESKFTPTLAGPISLPQEWIGKVDVFYSTSKNPRRDDVIDSAIYPNESLKPTNPLGAEDPNWHMEDAVVDWAKIHSFKLVLKDGMTIPSDQDIYYKMNAPQQIDDTSLLNPTPEQEAGKAAWNSFAATANNLLPVEPERVGVVLYTWSTSLRITKQNLADEVISGVEFTLFKKAEDGSLSEVSKMETDSAGTLRFTGLAIPTTDKDYYVLKETRSAPGYTSLEKDIEFSLNVNGQIELITSYQVNGLPVAELLADGLWEYAHLKIRNKNWTNLRLVKTNEDGSKRLNQAVFELKSIADNQVYRLETAAQDGEEGVAYLDYISLPTAGQVKEFELKELTAPAGYHPYLQTIYLTLDDKGVWTMRNQGDSDISLDMFTTNAERTDSQSQVHPVGEQIAQITVKNHPSFEIKIVKIDGADSNVLLSDVQFKIAATEEDAKAGRFIRRTAQSQLLLPGQSGYDEAEDYLITTDQTGRASFQGLNRNHNYWIVETKAKMGYRILAVPIEVQVPTDSEEQLEITVENHKIPELPHVGGIGILPNLFIGVCMIVASFVLAGRRKRIGYNVQK